MHADALSIAERNPEQERSWYRAEIAGSSGQRAHFSLREALRAHTPRLKHAMHCYYTCVVLSRGVANSHSSLSRLGGVTEMMERMTTFLFGTGGKSLYRAAANRCGLGDNAAAADAAAAAASATPMAHARPPPNWIVAARKRPLLAAERAASDVDTCNASSAHLDVLCHAGKMRRSGRALDVIHHCFKLDAVFDEECGNGAFAAALVAPLLAWLEATRRRATLLLFGQTGTGKTHSMSGALDYLFQYCDVRLPFLAAAAAAAAAAEGGTARVEVSFYEVKAKNCYDLLAERKRIRLLAGPDGRMHVRGARVVEVEASALAPAGSVSLRLEELLRGAMELRSTLTTERNTNSSRSHAVLQLKLDYGDGGEASQITLVDLAGSERKYETTTMSAAQHRESAAINTSLMALKDCCVAAHLGKVRIPYRANTLTRVLRDCFVTDGGELHRTVVVATLSPTVCRPLRIVCASFKTRRVSSHRVCFFLSLLFSSRQVGSRAPHAQHTQARDDDATRSRSIDNQNAVAPQSCWGERCVVARNVRTPLVMRSSQKLARRSCGRQVRSHCTAYRDNREDASSRRGAAPRCAKRSARGGECAASQHTCIAVCERRQRR